MLAGMGGVSLPPARRRRQRGRRVRHARRVDDAPRRDGRRDRRCAALTASPSASTCSPRARPGRGAGPRHHRRRRPHLRRRPRRAPGRRRPLPRQQRPRRHHVRQGPPRRRRGASGLRPRRRPGHRGRRPHRPGRHHGARARRWSTRSASGCRSSPPAGCSTGAGSPPRSRSAPTACGSAPASSPPPRRARCHGYKEALLGHRRGRHGRQPGLHRQDLPGRAQRLDAALRGPPGRAAAVPAQAVRLDAGRRQPPRAAPDGTEVDGAGHVAVAGPVRVEGRRERGDGDVVVEGRGRCRRTRPRRRRRGSSWCPRQTLTATRRSIVASASATMRVTRSPACSSSPMAPTP